MSAKSGKVMSAKGRTGKVMAKTAASAQPQSFDWIPLLTQSLTQSATQSGASQPVSCASVSSFKYAPLSEFWEDLVTVGLKVEVRNTDCSPDLAAEAYWIASVVRFAGYFVLLRYEGFGNDASKDFWLNVFTNQLHPVGWCASKGKILVPPIQIQNKLPDFKSFLIKRLTGSRTLPENFIDSLKDAIRSRFAVSMRLEVVDKERIAAVRVGVVDRVVGGRLHVKYEGESKTGNGYWCHQFSPLIHPVGWAQLIGHELRSTPDYANESLFKAVNNAFDANDATWTLFPPVKGPPLLSSNASNIHNNAVSNGQPNAVQRLAFEEGMKLEAIDPLNLSTICVATVTKVLRSNYLMIGIDGAMSPDGADWFCYHSSSHCIFPVGFCKINNIELTPPRNYEGEFDWSAYLKESNSIAAPVQLFRREAPRHSFQAGQLLEAVDLMDSRLVCVATITRVVNRLLRVHFNGWDENYDQWCDCEAPDLYPIGWCQLVGYPLEPPKDSDAASLNTSRRKKKSYTGKKKRKGRVSNPNNMTDSVSGVRAPASNYDSTCDSDAADEDGDYSEDTPCARESGAEDGFPIHPNLTTAPATPVKQKQRASSGSPRSVSDLSNSSVVVRPSPPEPVIKAAGRAAGLGGDPRTWTVSDVSSFLKDNFPGPSAAACTRRVSASHVLCCARPDCSVSAANRWCQTAFSDGRGSHETGRSEWCY